MPRLLIVAGTGAHDATRASLPFHHRPSTGRAGHECAVAPAGDATELLKPEIARTVRGVGVCPLADLNVGSRTSGKNRA